MPPSDVQRKLTSILCSDAVGYSRLMGDNPEDTLHTLTQYREVFSNKIKDYRGRVVNSPGDAILAEFASVLDTVSCAVEIQAELAERNRELPEHRRMDFRIGINLGDVLVKDGDIFGDGVNVAARLESLAKPGGICISSKAYQEVKNRLSYQYKFMGEQKVKNIAEPVQSYHVLTKPDDITDQAAYIDRLKSGASISGFKGAAGFIAAVLLAGGAWIGWEYFRPGHDGDTGRIPNSAAGLPVEDRSGDPGQKVFLDGTNGMVFVWVGGGSFDMGCGPWNDGECEDEEMPVRRVRLDGFWMSKYEVQVDEYLQFSRETGGNLPEWLDESNYYHYQKGQDDHYRKLGEALTGGNYPIVGVSWHDAVAFTIWLSRESGKNYRLPSEAEWEYACRGGGHPIKYAWGNGEPYVDKNRAANIADNSMRHAFPRLVIWNGYEDGYTYTAPVGSFAANSLGLHDMTGNVWEWVLDVFDEQAYRKSGSDNPIFASPSGSRAVRGGSWDDSSRDLRCSARDDDNPTDRDYNAGFRIVRTK